MTDGGKSAGQKAEELLAATLRSMDRLGGGTVEKNGAIAKNVMNEEMGFFGEPSHEYFLDEKRRDILLAHGRQDAAHALLNTISLLSQVQGLSREMWATRIMLVIVLCCLGYLVWRLH